MAQRKTSLACVFVLRLQTIFSGGACVVSVAVPEIFSLFSPKVNLKQELLSDPEGYMLALIKTMSLMDKDVNAGNSQGGMFWFIWWESPLRRCHSMPCLWENTFKKASSFFFFLTLFDHDGKSFLFKMCTPLQLCRSTAVRSQKSSGHWAHKKTHTILRWNVKATERAGRQKQATKWTD